MKVIAMEWLANALENPPIPHLHIDNQREKGFSPLYHANDLWAINIYHGSGELIIEGTKQKLIFQKGDIGLLPPGQKRRFYFNTRAHQQVTLFHFHNNYKNNRLTPEIIPSKEHFKRVGYSFKLLQQYAETRQTAREQSELWQLLWTVYEAIRTNKTDCTHPALQTAINYIDHHPCSDIVVSDIVRISGISHNHLNRLFNTTYNCSIKKFISLRKIQEIKYLLSSTDLPIKNIATDIGMPELQAFNKFFRKHTGISPRKYRKQNII